VVVGFVLVVQYLFFPGSCMCRCRVGESRRVEAPGLVVEAVVVRDDALWCVLVKLVAWFGGGTVWQSVTL
jgi:hypothetical protein